MRSAELVASLSQRSNQPSTLGALSALTEARDIVCLISTRLSASGNQTSNGSASASEKKGSKKQSGNGNISKPSPVPSTLGSTSSKALRAELARVQTRLDEAVKEVLDKYTDEAIDELKSDAVKLELERVVGVSQRYFWMWGQNCARDGDGERAG